MSVGVSICFLLPIAIQFEQHNDAAFFPSVYIWTFKAKSGVNRCVTLCFGLQLDSTSQHVCFCAKTMPFYYHNSVVLMKSGMAIPLAVILLFRIILAILVLFVCLFSLCVYFVSAVILIISPLCYLDFSSHNF